MTHQDLHYRCSDAVAAEPARLQEVLTTAEVLAGHMLAAPIAAAAGRAGVGTVADTPEVRTLRTEAGSLHTGAEVGTAHIHQNLQEVHVRSFQAGKHLQHVMTKSVFMQVRCCCCC